MKLWLILLFSLLDLVGCLQTMRSRGLTVSDAWAMLSPSVKHASPAGRMILKRACLLAFIKLNDSVDERGDALILRSIRNAQDTMELLTPLTTDSGSDVRENDMIAAFAAVLLRDAVGMAKLLPREEPVLELLGEAIVRRVELAALETTKDDFHVAVRAALQRSDGLAAALLIESRAELCDHSDAQLLKEACEWCDRCGALQLRRVFDERLLRLEGVLRLADVQRAPRFDLAMSRPLRPHRVPAGVLIMAETPDESDKAPKRINGGVEQQADGSDDDDPPFGGIPVFEIALVVAIAYGAMT